MNTVVIYSEKNEKSLAKVKTWRKRYSKFIFIELSDSKLISEQRKNGSKIIELDKPVKKKAPVKNTKPKKEDKPKKKKVSKKKSK